MRLIKLLSCGFLFLAVSCSVNELARPELSSDVVNDVFYVYIDEQPAVETKVYADENFQVLWNNDDRFSIFNKNTFNQQYRFSGEDGSNSGKISIVGSSGVGDPLGKVYSVYPYDESSLIDKNGVITTQFPSEQTYLADSFGRGANLMVSVTDDAKLRFKNAGGYLSLKLYGEGVSVSSINLRSNNFESLSGPCSIETSSGVPEMKFSEDQGIGEVTLTCPTPVELGTSASEAVQFVFVLPPVTLRAGFTVTVFTSDGSAFRKTTKKSRTIGRSSITSMEAFEVILSPSTSVEVTDETSSYPFFFDEEQRSVTEAFDDPDSFFAEAEPDGTVLIRDFDRLLMSYMHMPEGSTLDYWVYDDTFKVGDVSYHRAELKTPVPYFLLSIVDYDGEDFVLGEVIPYNGKDIDLSSYSGPESSSHISMILLVDESGHLMLYIVSPYFFNRSLTVPVTCEDLLTTEALSNSFINSRIQSMLGEPIEEGVELRDILAELVYMQSELDYSNF